MDNALSPREIQTRIREGASAAEVAEETGMPLARIEAFAGPVLAEREHIALLARTSTVRRRGETGTHRRLGELIDMRLSARGLSADELAWDSWRQADLKWRVVASLEMAPQARVGEFVFDHKGRFSVALNTDARWLIGEEQLDAKPEDENTVDFDDELALVRATQEESSTDDAPGNEVPASDLMLEHNEDTSQLDRLYDMLSGISEDSVRIYTGITDEYIDDTPDEPVTETSQPVPQRAAPEPEMFHEPEPEPEPQPAPAPEPEPVAAEPVQEPLVQERARTKKPRGRKGRATIPSWDEIMFGGPSA